MKPNFFFFSLSIFCKVFFLKFIFYFYDITKNRNLFFKINYVLKGKINTIKQTFKLFLFNRKYFLIFEDLAYNIRIL